MPYQSFCYIDDPSVQSEVLDGTMTQCPHYNSGEEPVSLSSSTITSKDTNTQLAIPTEKSQDGSMTKCLVSELPADASQRKKHSLRI